MTFAREGGERDEARDVLTELRTARISEAQEDRILELEDVVEGWVQPHLVVWR